MPTVIEVNVQTGERGEREMTEEEIAALPPAKTNSQKLAEGLAELNAAYQLDLDAYRKQWNSILIIGGTLEETKKTALRTTWTNRGLQYQSDRAALIAQYS